jgi:putative DNA primase/helicase
VALESIAVDRGLTETAAAERFAATYGADLRYDHSRRQWFVYREHLWKTDRDGEVKRRAIQCARDLQAEGSSLLDSAARNKVMSFAKFCQSQPGISRVLSIAQNLEPLACTGEDWNRDPWLLGASNGVLNLKTGDISPGEREDLISLCLGVPHDPEADCPRWKRFVSEVFGGDETLVEYLQRVLGYTLTGFTTEQVWFLLFGDGANGKSTLLNVVGHVLGDYAKTVPFSMFELPQRSAVPDDVATLVDRRYVTASESIEAAKLNESRIKMLTGGDRIPARPLYGQWFEFDPHLKLFLSCNHKPKVADDSHGFWRRVHVVPFTKRFDGEHRDERLTESLEAEGSGILNWMLEGCLLWQCGGVKPPPSVLVATSEYESESNPLNDFLAERCQVGEAFTASANRLFEAYRSWATSSDSFTTAPLTGTAFGRWMGKCFRKQHRSDGNVYIGVRLKA